jgi:hypothetical protein
MLEKILLAVDESDHARKAVPAVVQLAACPVLVVRDKQSLDERHHDVLRAQTRFQA